MLLTRYNHRDLEPAIFGNLVDKFFNESYFGTEQKTSFSPKVDVVETDTEFELRFAVPGIDKEQISITVEKGELTVSGDRKKEKEEEGRSYKSIESAYGSFARSFHLPENIDEDKIEGSYKNGILTIKVPKVEPKKVVKQIAIN